MQIDIKKLVDDIHAAEKLHRTSWDEWTKFCKARNYSPWRYADVVTGLYTLRAWGRGRLHRKNPPAHVRDYNRSMRETGREKLCTEWDAEEHNRKLAERVGQQYLREEEESACA